MARATFGKIARSDWLLCNQKSCHLGPLQRSVRFSDGPAISKVQEIVSSLENKSKIFFFFF